MPVKTSTCQPRLAGRLVWLVSVVFIEFAYSAGGSGFKYLPGWENMYPRNCGESCLRLNELLPISGRGNYIEPVLATLPPCHWLRNDLAMTRSPR